MESWSCPLFHCRGPLAGLVRVSAAGCFHEHGPLTRMAPEADLLRAYYEHWDEKRDFYAVQVMATARLRNLEKLSFRRTRPSQNRGRAGMASISLSKPLFKTHFEVDPSQWLAEQSTHCRAFQQVDTVAEPDLSVILAMSVQEVLRGWGLNSDSNSAVDHSQERRALSQEPPSKNPLFLVREGKTLRAFPRSFQNFPEFLPESPSRTGGMAQYCRHVPSRKWQLSLGTFFSRNLLAILRQSVLVHDPQGLHPDQAGHLHPGLSNSTCLKSHAAAVGVW